MGRLHQDAPEKLKAAEDLNTTMGRTEPFVLRIGCAGWSIPRIHSERFPAGASHLERYSLRFSCVEINSSFYRSHLPATYARWAESTPASFRFAVKVPREITHTRRLVRADEPLGQFLSEVSELGEKLGPLLIQLPPSLEYDSATAGAFLAYLRGRFSGDVVCEPRHASWFESGSDQMLFEHKIARVAADPATVPLAALPGGWRGLDYYRLHGSPRVYYSAYSEADLEILSRALYEAGTRGCGWCIFDNTAAGDAITDAIRTGELTAGLCDGSVGPEQIPVSR